MRGAGGGCPRIDRQKSEFSGPFSRSHLGIIKRIWKGKRGVQVKAVVVDSIAAPFRAVEGMQWQHQAVMLATVGRMLRRIAARGVAVVVLNQVVGGASGGSDDLKPALGTQNSQQLCTST